MAPHGLTLYDLLTRAALLFGGRRAVVHDSTELGYRELLDRVDRLANGLAELGVAPGERISVLSQNNLEYFELYLAAAKRGIVVYPINWRLTAEEVGHVVTRAAPTAFVYDAASAAAAATVRAAHPDVSHWIGIGTGDDAQPFASLYSSRAAPAHQATPDELFVVISTAAVDVIPRGAAMTHANTVASTAQTVAAMGLNETDCHLLCLPLFHITALGLALAMVHCGGCNIISSKFEAAEVVHNSDALGGTLIGNFPPMLASVLDAADELTSTLPNLRHVIGLDGPEPIQRLHEKTEASFWTGFGQSETSGFVTLQKVTDRPGCSGRAGLLADVAVFDESDQPVSIGEVGEIVVRGPLVMREYFGQPDVTAAVFRNGWHHTGDLGRLDTDGYLTYAGRKPEKELIKSGGENVYPAEVEGVIDELEAVRGACVFGVPDDHWGEAVHAVVEAHVDAITAEAIIEHVGSRIGRFKRPRKVMFAEVLPRTGDGKVDRAAIKATWT